jgi:hypothetical protein
MAVHGENITAVEWISASIAGSSKPQPNSTEPAELSKDTGNTRSVSSPTLESSSVKKSVAHISKK